MFIKRTPPLIFHWELSTNTFDGKNVMIWQKYGAVQNVRQSGKRGERVDKKRNKKWRRGSVRSQKMWCHSLRKNENFRVTFFLNSRYDDVLLCCIFYERILLMVSLDFHETNKPYISKEIFIIYTKQDLQNYIE